MKKVTVIGLGWVGLPLAQALLSQGIHVVGTKRHQMVLKPLKRLELSVMH